MEPKSKKIILGIALIALLILVTFSVLLFHSVSSIAVESWGMETEYQESESSWFGLVTTPSKFTVRITIAIGNKGAFTVTIWDPTVKLVINGIYMGTLNFQEDWYIIPAFGWKQWVGTFTVTEANADSLHFATNLRPPNLNAHLRLRGEASCILYRTIFETSS